MGTGGGETTLPSRVGVAVALSVVEGLGGLGGAERAVGEEVGGREKFAGKGWSLAQRARRTLRSLSVEQV